MKKLTKIETIKLNGNEAIKFTDVSGTDLMIDVCEEGFIGFNFNCTQYVLLETKALFNILTSIFDTKGEVIEIEADLLAWYGEILKFKVEGNLDNCTLSIIEQEDFPPHQFKKEPFIKLEKEQIVSLVEFLSNKELN